MRDWTGGYVADVGYTQGYFGELAPPWLRLSLLLEGLAPPAVETACELGYGQGLSVNIHAAAGTARWHGTDFLPVHAVRANALATACASGALLRDEAFADFCARHDLPDFDFIALHGIWSWVSDADRAVIVDFVRRRLKPGGVLYLSYNALPGWAAFAPTRYLMARHGQTSVPPGAGSAARVDAALDFTAQVLAAKPLYAQAHPGLAERMAKVREHGRAYLAHEYFNRHWVPMHFGDVAEALAPARVSFAASANPLDHVDVMNLAPPQSALLQQVADPVLREDVRDFMVNRQFRRDYWVKGARRLDAVEHAEQLRALRVVLARHREDVSLKVATVRGEAALQEAVYVPMLDLLADHQPRTLGELEAALRPRGIVRAQIAQAVAVLAGTGALKPVQDDDAAARARPAAQRLNRQLMLAARAADEVVVLASPLTGGGVPASRFAQLFLLARAQGAAEPAQWARFAWRLLEAQGQRLVRDGGTLEAPADNLRELEAQAAAFAQKQLPLLQALQVA
jgi:SAM-dependent methyltransferase